MSFIRQSAYRSIAAARAVRSSPRAFSVQSARQAQQGYGDPKGNPTSSNPQEQGKNPQVGKEHPGPEAPSAAKKSSGGGDSTPSSSGSSSQGKNGARPALHDNSEPDNSSEEVRKHNEEFEELQKKKFEKDDNAEKVDPKFWKGHADDKPQ